MLPSRDECFDVTCKDAVEHLRVEHSYMHFRGVWMVLRQNGRYLVFTPPRLRRDFSIGAHLTSYCLADPIPNLRRNGFRIEVISPLPFVVESPCNTLGRIISPPRWFCAIKLAHRER
jgi:hypothetical protein